MADIVGDKLGGKNTFSEQEAQNLALGTPRKVILNGANTYNASQVISIQCDIESNYSATYANGDALPAAIRVQNSVRSGIFTEVVQTVGRTILLVQG